MGRLLAFCGWLAWQVRRPLRGLGKAPVVIVAVLLLVLAAVPIVLPLLDAQPEDVAVQDIIDGAVTEPSGWVRLRGRVTPLAEAPSDGPGTYALLVDEANALRAIVLRSDEQLRPMESTSVTGHLVPDTVVVEEDLPIEATVAGTPPMIVPDRVVETDPITKPDRAVLWPISIIPALLAVLLLVGAQVDYPIFRQTTEVDVLAAPLGPGERLPAAFGGRVGPTVRELADPGGALLLVRRGPNGNLLTAQPLAEEDGGLAPAPVNIGGSWTRGRLGYVHTLTETIPALVIRSELVDATFLFARTAERDRVAALVAVDR